MGPLQIVLPGLGCGTNLAARSRNSVGTEPSLHGDTSDKKQCVHTKSLSLRVDARKNNDLCFTAQIRLLAARTEPRLDYLQL